MKESPISAEDEELRKILEKITFAYRLDDSLWAFDPEELLSAIQSYSQKKYQEGELKVLEELTHHWQTGTGEYRDEDSYHWMHRITVYVLSRITELKSQLEKEEQ